MQFRKGSAWRTITSGVAYTSGAWRELSNGKGFNTRWRDVCNFTAATPTPTPTPPPTPSPTPTPTPTPVMTLAVSPSSLTKSGTTSTIISGTATATPSGGKSPYNYLWSIVGSDGNIFVLGTPANASCNVTVRGMDFNSTASCSIQCVCTDSIGSVAPSSIIPVLFINTGTGGGVIP